jgi:hypothetical protein
MKEYYGNYLGICINNQDPEYRGRVQIFIPHIMPALYEGWNQENQDISIECVGNNLPNGLSPAIIEKLTKILPWAEGAMPIVGTSVGGQYNPATGNFNQTAVPEGGFSAQQINPDVFGGSFTSELSNPDVQRKLFNLMEAEVGGQGTQAQLAWMETVRNRATVRGVSIDTIISDTKYYEPYKTGAINRAAARLTNEKVTSYKDTVNKALAGSNITNGATHNASTTVAASVKRGGFNSVQSSIIDIGGETFYSKISEQNKLSKIFDPKAMTLNDVAGNPTPAALIPTTPFWQNPPAVPWTQQQPDQSAVTQVNAPTPVSVADVNGLMAKMQKASFNSGQFGGGSTNNCGKIARGVDYNLLQDSYFQKGIGGNAKDSVPYFVNSGYYEVNNISPGQAIPFGSKIVFQVGKGDAKSGRTGNAKRGHVTTVGENGTLFGSLPGESFKSYENLRGDQRVTVLTPTNKYNQRMQQLYSLQNLPGYSLQEITNSSRISQDVDEGAADSTTNIVGSPSPTQIIPTDTSGMPAGVFAIPGPGAMLWVFFREGDPLFPVYFAASYGKTEWQNAYQANSQPADYGNVSVMRTGAADATISNSNLENPYTRQVSFNGSYNEYDLYGQNQFVRGNKHSYTEGIENRQCAGRQTLCVQDAMDCTLGDRKTIVGNPSQECLEQVQKIKQKIAQVNKKMLEGGNNSSSS